MWIFFWWIFLSILVGLYASRKKRSGGGWFLLSLLISPLIAFIIVLVIGLSSSSLKKCPRCAEDVKVEAQICRFCNYEFPLPVLIDRQEEEKKMVEERREAEKRTSEEKQIRAKPMPKFKNQEEYEKWKAERFQSMHHNKPNG